MATMMKEKPRQKKKTKEKRVGNNEVPGVEPSTANVPMIEKEIPSPQVVIDQDKLEDTHLPSTSVIKEVASSETESAQSETLTETSHSSILVQSPVTERNQIDSETISNFRNEIPQKSVAADQSQGVYKGLCHRLDIISFKDVPVSSDMPVEELESKLEASTFYISQGTDQTQSAEQTVENISIPAGVIENIMPSAPMFEEPLVAETPDEPQTTKHEIKLERLQCMPLEMAMHICGGKEMAEVREMSEREESLARGMSLRPEHPLVDLLSTYRCSAIALEQESENIVKRFSDEEKSRAALWRVEKTTVTETEKCRKCERSVTYTGQFEVATLLTEKLPAAKLRLEGLLKDVQESYCTYQHQALLAYYQIEEFISETIRSGIGDIREALTLVLQELRASDSITCLNMEYFTDSLKRWAKALCGALLGKSDARQLLFLLHQLFRQTHSVRWAAPLIRVPMCDTSDAARTLAILDLMLAAPVLETAKECTEENEEIWEEVDRHGGSGAVSDGALRERDLLALLRAFPLQALVARLVLLQRTDITQTRPYEWQHAARDVLRACCGVRALLATLARAAHAHPAYTRLRGDLRALAAHAQHAAAALHVHNRDTYPKEMAVQIEAELEAIFRAGWGLLEPGAEAAGPLEAPPAALLRPAVRAAYCVALMTNLHEKQPLVVDSLSLSLSLTCGQCVHALSQAVHSEDSTETVSMVADFLVQVALKRSKHCNGACVDAARECLPKLLSEHDYLYTGVVHSIAYVNQLEPLQPSAAILKPFRLQRWRPSPVEIRAVLDDWSQRSAALLPYLLQELSYTPYDGLCLESQLAVGSWLCGLPAPAPDWAWAVLVKLRVHRSSWGLPIDAPPPERTQGLFAEAYAVLASSWGHSLPLICEYGVGALGRVAAARAPVAAHALPLLMAAMMHSPESVGLTPQFASLASTLLAPPQSLVQWARGERAAAPELLVRRMLAHVDSQPSAADRDAAVSTWLQALCHTGLAGAPLAACDALLLATRHTYTLPEAPKPEVVSHLVRNATHAPLTCAAALLAAHKHYELSVLFPRLLYALAQQRASNQKIHVDNALKQIGASISSDELVIHQTAAALLAPAGQPSLPLWWLLMHLYLHSSNISSDPAPIGPLFFSGLVKSRTLTQLKKRLHETILHHHKEAATFKTLLNTRPEPKPRSKSKSKSTSPETLLPTTSLGDLTGESSASETDSGGETDVSEGEERRRVNVNMVAYHEAAEIMLREYACWLEAGDRLRATPHHADVARFVPDAALITAWAEQLKSIRPAPSSEDDDLRAPRTPSAPEPPLTPLQSAVQRILRIKDLGQKRVQVPTITSPLGDADFDSPRQLYMLVDKHLAGVETFARQWSADVERVAALDARLWPLVGGLRCRRKLPAVRKPCPNQCGPVLLDLQGHSEWPISENAARGITENRASAKAAMRDLLRARPNDAKTVAALNTIARRIGSLELAVGVAQRAWGCAARAHGCCAARAALAAVVDVLAERWICSNANALSALVPSWCAASTPAQQALCRSLLARGVNGPRLYTALVRALCERECDPQLAFSYLSKFDVSRCADESARAEMLEALSNAAQRWGREPPPEIHMLLELIGVHTVTLTTASQLPAVVVSAAAAAGAGRAPPARVAHAARAAERAKQVPFDKLGHLLRELGMIWWRARTDLQTSGATYHATYAEHVAALHHALQRAFVAQAVALSYTPERVAMCAWSGLREAWAAWAAPHPALPPLLAGEPYAHMLRHFVDGLHQCMLDCPGCEEHLLCQVWEWTIQIYLNVTGAPSAARDSRVQLSELLAQLGSLPWGEHQWVRANCLPVALQIITTTDLELQTWVADTLRGVHAACWLRGASDGELAPQLAGLLRLLAGPLRLRTETLAQASHLPWQRLPGPALEQALERFFVEHHSPQHPYHDAPQFQVILAASGLEPARAHARSQRACAVSQWTRAASAPALLAHVGAQAAELLQLVAALEPYVEEGSDELEELLGRAVIIMCMEPAAAEALPVWVKWISRASPRLLRACVSAARSLTTLDYFASVADAAASAFMNAGGTWSELSGRLQGCAWAEPAPLLQRGRLHAAYALALTAPAHAADLAAITNFGSKELMVAVWTCALCRGADDVTAREQLARWAGPPRMALLRVLSAADEPTDRHRLLCRLALCILSPNSEPLIANLVRAYEACPSTLVSQADLVSWAGTPNVKHLSTLAMALFPGSENYFAEEVRMASAM